MKRRDFIKTLGLAAGGTVLMPSTLTSMFKYARAVDYTGTSITPPSILPQVINIFLYGGASELAGNLTNIADIDTNSQNSYAVAFGDRILRFQNDAAGGVITPYGFWGSDPTNVDFPGAGGDDMQFLVDEGYMSVYRTIFKQKDPTRSHRESILMSQKGSLDIENGAGIGARIAEILVRNQTVYNTAGITLADSTPITNIESQLILPFVSFEGDSRIFQTETDPATDPALRPPLSYRGITLDSNFDDPFSRGNNNDDATITALVNKVVTSAQIERFKSVVDAFELRTELALRIGDLQADAAAPLPTIADPDDVTGNGGSSAIDYGGTGFGDRLQAAVTLAIENPSTLFISVSGSSGLGGWDDHNNGVDDYPTRMTELFEALKAAMFHIKYSNGTTPGSLSRTTDNIIINVFGDFGRRVNLNDAQGWDHGNCQNLYTLGGAGIRVGGAAALGKVVGQTQRVGNPGSNDQFTEPVDPENESFEPMAIAASIYSYFGVDNPAVITATDGVDTDGDDPINETLTGISPLFT